MNKILNTNCLYEYNALKQPVLLWEGLAYTAGSILSLADNIDNYNYLLFCVCRTQCYQDSSQHIVKIDAYDNTTQFIFFSGYGTEWTRIKYDKNDHTKILISDTLNALSIQKIYGIK